MTILARDDMGATVQAIRPGTVQTVAIGAASAASAAVGVRTTIVRVAATADCHIVIGANPTATANDTPLFAKQPEFFAIVPGEKIAVIQSSGAGTLFITEGANF